MTERSASRSTAVAAQQCLIGLVMIFALAACGGDAELSGLTAGGSVASPDIGEGDAARRGEDGRSHSDTSQPQKTR